MLFKDYTPYSDSSALADVSERSYFFEQFGSPANGQVCQTAGGGFRVVAAALQHSVTHRTHIAPEILRRPSGALWQRSQCLLTCDGNVSCIDAAAGVKIFAEIR